MLLVESSTTLSARMLQSFFIILLVTTHVLCYKSHYVIRQSNEPSLPPTCDSQIYCQGDLLHDVQLARLYNDSKTFVDMKLKYKESDIVQKYKELRSSIGTTPSNDDLLKFIGENFEAGDELELCEPKEYTGDPPLIKKISSPEYKSWAKSLIDIFANLTRKVKLDVLENSEHYSFLYVPNCFIIPGGRFTELYYWDSYWIVDGLLLTDQPQMARGVIENLLHLIRRHGVIPNGSRKYYLARSQPPLVCFMVWKYFEHTNDLDFVKKNIDVLEKEYSYWVKNQMVDVEKDGNRYKMFRYFAPSSGPRPESYREDYETAGNLTDTNQKNQLYINIKSAAESGLDFSTRWIIKDGTNDGQLSDTQAIYIIPVDLNSFLYKCAKIISYFNSILGDSMKAMKFKLRAASLLRAIDAVLWRKDRGIWLDYDIKNKKSRDYFYLSNFTPLWTISYSESKAYISKAVLAYLKQSRADQYIGCVPSSLYNTGLQWDLPNCWPPQEGILIQGLDALGTPEAKAEARRLAEQWLGTNYEGFLKYSAMFEKYNALTKGETGSGGEYIPQTGFGWTNGVVLELLYKYWDSAPDKGSNYSS